MGFPDSAENLKGAIAHLERWANLWEMECGVRKCAVMLVSSSPEIDPIATLETEGLWRLHGQDVPLVRTYRYLGFELTDDLQPDVHMVARIQGATGAFGRCHRFLTTTISLGIRGMVYKIMVLPILSWGCELLPLDRAPKLDCSGKCRTGNCEHLPAYGQILVLAAL